MFNDWSKKDYKRDEFKNYTKVDGDSLKFATSQVEGFVEVSMTSEKILEDDKNHQPTAVTCMNVWWISFKYGLSKWCCLLRYVNGSNSQNVIRYH